MRQDLTGARGSCEGKPWCVSASGVTVRDMASSDAAVTWIPLDRDSWDFLVSLSSVWVELWSEEIANVAMSLSYQITVAQVSLHVVSFYTCVGARLSICMGDRGYMLCSTGVPAPYRPGESVGRVLEDTVL